MVALPIAVVEARVHEKEVGFEVRMRNRAELSALRRARLTSMYRMPAFIRASPRLVQLDSCPKNLMSPT